MLREPSKMHLGGHQGHVTYAHISVWMEPHLLNTFYLNIGIQNNVPETQDTYWTLILNNS